MLCGGFLLLYMRLIPSFQNFDGGTGSDAGCSGIDHGSAGFPVADASCRFHLHFGANGFFHQADILHGGAGSTEAGAGFDEVRFYFICDFGDGFDLFLGEIAVLENDFD